MSAKAEIANALKPWLSHDSWHSNQVLDASRFYRAMAQVVANTGTVWTESEFKEAIYELIGNDKRAEFEGHIEDYTSIAMNIRDYETVRPELLFPDSLIGATRAYRA